jgi:DNA-binding GntR family transcriptional regulator
MVLGDTHRMSAHREHSGAAYERLTQAISAGELKPGQPLVESMLAQWFQMSRTPVREALKRLEHRTGSSCAAIVG